MRHWFSCAYVALLFCTACGSAGSRAVFPASSDYGSRLAPQSVATGPALVQVNAGGPATGSFSADQFFVGYSGTNSDATPVDVRASGSAPQAVYRTAPKLLTYHVTGLAPLGAYTGELYFEEPLLGGSGRRVMTVTVGGVTETTGLDIFALTGATHKAYTMPMTGTATVNGTLDIVLTATVNDTIISGFMLQPALGTLGLTDVEINAGGPATAGFAADRYFSGYSGTNADTNPIDVSAPNAAPATVYASYRTSPKTLFYNIPNLVPNTRYHGFLHFEEPLLGGVGRRVESLAVAEVTVVDNLDIYKAAGRTHKAVVVPFDALADGTGAIDIQITASAGAAIISGFELHEDVTPIPTPSSLPSGSPMSGAFTRFTPVSGNFVPGIAAGPDGALWFTESGSPAIGRISLDGHITNYPTASTATPWAIVNGPDEALWFTDLATNAIGRITTSGAITEFSISHPHAEPLAITVGPDGALWLAENDRIGRMTTAGAYSEFLLPRHGSLTHAIAAGPDGALWFTEEQGSAIGRITTSGTITEYSALSDQFGQTISSPISIAPGADGAMWFGDVGRNTIGRIAMNGAILEFPVPNGFPTYLTAGPDNAMYLADGNAIVRVSLGGIVTNTYPIPSPGSAAQSLALGPDGALWMGQGSPAAIERLR